MQGDQVQSLVGEPRPHMPQLSLSAAAREAHSMKIQHSQDRWKEKNLKKILSSIFKKVLYMFLWSWTQTSYILFIHIYYLYSNFIYIYICIASLMAQWQRICLPMQEIRIWSQGGKNSLEEKNDTPVFLPGISHRWRSLADYNHGVTKELDMTKRLNNTTYIYINTYMYIYI